MMVWRQWHWHKETSEGQLRLSILEVKLETCAEQEWLMYWTRDVEDEATRQEEKRRTSEKIQGCSGGGHVEGCCDRGGWQEQGEISNSASDILTLERIIAVLTVICLVNEQRNVLRKQRHWEKQVAAKKSRRKEEKLRRKMNRELESGKEKTKRSLRRNWKSPAGDITASVPFLCVLWHSGASTERQFTKRVMKAITKERLAEARSTGLKLCVDLSMTDCMSDKVGGQWITLQRFQLTKKLLSFKKVVFIHCSSARFVFQEISRLAGQLRRLYGSNKKATRPFHLFLTELREDSRLYRECVRMNDGFLNYTVIYISLFLQLKGF